MDIIRTGRVHRVGGVPSRGVTPAVATRAAPAPRVQRLDNNAHAEGTPANNDKGEPTTPSDSSPKLPNPDSVVPENRDQEDTDAEELHAKTSEGAMMNWFDELGS